MTEQEILTILSCAIPMYTALICGLLLLRLYRRGESQLGGKSIRVTLWAYGSAVCGWLLIVFYVAMPWMFIIFNAPVMWVFMGVNVMYHRFVFEMTKTHEDEKFPMWHFVAPTLIALVLFVWSFFVPFDVQLRLVESRGEMAADYPYYSVLFTSKPLLFVIFYVVYLFLGIRRVVHFRRIIVNYSADEERTSLRWLYQILFVMLGILPLAVALVVFTKQEFASFPIVLLPSIVFMFKDIVLVHNVLIDNFVVIDTPQEQLQAAYIGNQSLEQTTREDIRRLETYMRKQKPFLNPKLKITDMMDALNTNRSSLSLLINRTYGMNFCRYVNRYRLQELEKIKTDPQNGELSDIELVAKAGFSDWRGYLRVKQREEVNI